MDRMNYVNMSCTTCKLSMHALCRHVHKNCSQGGWEERGVVHGKVLIFSEIGAHFFGGKCVFFRRKPVATQPGRSRAPILHFLAPLFDQSGSSRAPICASGPVWKQLKSPKNMTKPCTNAVFNEFGCFPTVVPDSIPTGSRLPTGPRLDPWIGKNPLPHLLSPAQAHPCPFPRTSRAPIPPHPAPKRPKQS